MPCNSGVSLIPTINGKVERFAARGLYNGLVLLADETTNSYFDHITGECLHGKLKGYQLDFSDYDLLYTTVEAALQQQTNVQLAIPTERSLKSRFTSIMTPLFNRFSGNWLPSRFIKTMGEEDTRRERRDLGLGLWTDTVYRYYPLEHIQAAEAGILDAVDDKSVFIYYSDIAKAPDAIFVEANSVRKQDDVYIFDTGKSLQNGKLCSENDEELPVKRPQQMFTRWYGFAYTFPNCEIYGE